DARFPAPPRWGDGGGWRAGHRDRGFAEIGVDDALGERDEPVAATGLPHPAHARAAAGGAHPLQARETLAGARDAVDRRHGGERLAVGVAGEIAARFPPAPEREAVRVYAP